MVNSNTKQNVMVLFMWTEEKNKKGKKNCGCDQLIIPQNAKDNSPPASSSFLD